MTLGQRSNVWMYGNRVGLKKSHSAHLKIFGLISLVDVTLYVICSDMSVTPSEITICSRLRGSEHPIHVRTHSRRSDSSPLEGRKLTADWESETSFKLNQRRDLFQIPDGCKMYGWVVSSTCRVRAGWRQKQIQHDFAVCLLTSFFALRKVCNWHLMQHL